MKNVKCFYHKFKKKIKKGYQTMIHLKSGSPEWLFGALLGNAQMIQK
jgi:hypothetical protein